MSFFYCDVKLKMRKNEKKVKKDVDNIKRGWYYIRALRSARELRSLKTEQETSIQKILGNNERKVRS